MTQYKVKDTSLNEEGKKSIEWAESRMPVLIKIREDFIKKKPLKGMIIGASLHVTKETAVLVRTLEAGGAEVALCASNPLSTQDEIAAALVLDKTHVYAWKGENNEEYYWCINQVLDHNPNITLDDGADLVGTLHEKRQELLNEIFGGTEETTSGVIRLKAMELSGELRYPIIAVNNASTKYLFDNRYGTGQSSIDGLLRSTSVLLAGKVFVVAGYGWCSRGIAMRARGMGSNVIVTEADPLRALEAVMDGFSVMPMKEAAKIGDVFITATGNIDVIRREHIDKIKNGGILANAGHFNVEINLEDLKNLSTSKRNVRPNVEEYLLKNGRKIYLLAEGRLVNLAAAEGHPSEVMMMSFANQALCTEYIAKHHNELKKKVFDVPKVIDLKIARLALESLGIRIDDLTKKQIDYLGEWKIGT
ncbi:MAG: adenosylhomocysteinase [Candidatus Bathyarchaeota archaeon]|nr:adenosylhomocysteinase [Candidatus Bathyarchaeota archaeon]